MCSKYDHHYMFDSQRDFLIHFYFKKYIYCGGAIWTFDEGKDHHFDGE